MRPAVILFTLVVIVATCSKPPRTDSSLNQSAAVPVTLIVEQEISGQVLGVSLLAPFGLAVDQQGSVYVVDSGNDRIVRFNEALEPVRDIGGHGSAPGLFDQPGFITIDNELNVYIADVGNRRVCRHNRRLEYVDEIQLQSDDDPFLLRRATGLAVSDFGELWMGDEENNRLALFDNIGQFDRFVGDYGYGGGELQSPQKVVRTASAEFLVCDAANGRLVFYDEYGNFDRDLEPPGVFSPSAVAQDSQKRIWILDRNASTIACITPSGSKLLMSSEQLPGTDRSMQSPADLAFMRDGRLLISDTGNNRLLVCKVVQEES